MLRTINWLANETVFAALVNKIQLINQLCNEVIADERAY